MNAASITLGALGGLGGLGGLGAVLAASALGSLHCAAMCGPLMALHARGASPSRHAASWRDVALHQLGRGAGYVVLGLLAGGAGKLVDLAGAALAVQRAAMLIAVAAFVLCGLGLAVVALRAPARPRPAAPSVPPARTVAGAGARARLRRFRPARLLAALGALGAPGASRGAGRDLVQLRTRPPIRRALGMGLLNAALPCGWLWAFVALAASTGAPLTGAATMLAFWLGTLPALVGAAALVAPLVGRLRSRWPLVTAGLVLSLAGAAILLRLPLLAPASAGEGAAPACHHAAPRLELPNVSDRPEVTP